MPPPNNPEMLLAQALGGRPASPSTDRAWSDDGPLPVEIVMAGDHRVLLDVLWAGEGRLGDVRRVLDRQPDPWPRRLVVAAHRFSPAALELLRERDANWVDARGRAHIVDVGLIVLRDEAPRTEPTRGLTWSASALSIAEVILANEWPNGIAVGMLVDVVGWSRAQVSQVLQMFDAQGWTKKFGPQRGPGSRRELVDADALLNAWALALSSEHLPTRQAHRIHADFEHFFRHDLLPNLDQKKVEWAAGGWMGASLLAPFATHLPALDIYVAEEHFFQPLSDVMRLSDLREVDEGGSVRFVSVPSQVLTLGRRLGPVPVVSAPRIYVDLLRLGGRAEDVAEHLRDEVIAGLHRPFHAQKTLGELHHWEESSRLRALAESRQAGQEHLYEHGVWTVSYRLDMTSAPPTQTRLLELLQQNVGHETGWPMWNTRFGRPRNAEGVIENWLPWHIKIDGGSADYWRATPDGRFFLLRGYQEDTEMERLEPGTAVETTLPIWRVGEALLHAARMAKALDAPRLELLMRWEGLLGRRLGSEKLEERSRPSNASTIEAAVDVRTDAIEAHLPRLVRDLVSPLFTAFGFSELPMAFYEHEVAAMRRPV